MHRHRPDRQDGWFSMAASNFYRSFEIKGKMDMLPRTRNQAFFHDRIQKPSGCPVKKDFRWDGRPETKINVCRMALVGTYLRSIITEYESFLITRLNNLIDQFTGQLTTA